MTVREADAAAAAALVPARRRNWPRIWTGVVGVAGVVGVIGALLPWVRLQAAGIDITHTGLEAAGDGYITLGIGAILAGLAARGLLREGRPGRAFGWGVMIGGFFLLTIPALDYQAFRASLMSVSPETAVLVRPEAGLYASTVAGAVAIVGGWRASRRPRRSTSPAPAPVESSHDPA